MTLRSIVPAVGLALMFAAAACGDDPPDVDCLQLCRDYDECVRDIDVDACVNACDFEVDVFEREARNCQRCTEGLTCPEQSSCWAPKGDCVDFVAFMARNGRFDPDD
jgi:hypothetical protein